jgi:putative tryptophan/tyrosine transport system substrate-binding protein
MCWRGRTGWFDDSRSFAFLQNPEYIGQNLKFSLKLASAVKTMDNKTTARFSNFHIGRRPFKPSRRIEKQTCFFLVGVLLLALSFPSRAQPQARLRRIGFLGNSTPALEENLVGPFLEGLRERGYVDGKNISIEYRWAEGRYERFPALISELVGANVELIVTAGTPASLAVQKTTATIPLVMIAVGDPVGTGLIKSLAHPGGNITGLTSIASDLEGKRLELLREVTPKVSHIAVLWNPASPFQVVSEKELQTAARALRMKVLSLGVKASEELDKAFAAILKHRPGALLVLADRLFLHNRARIMGFALQHRFPGIHAYVELVEAGGLMSYGPSYPGMHRRAAYFVDRILKGTKPSDLPVEQPTKFELVINLKTAKQIGLTIPPNVLVRADRVIR